MFFDFISKNNKKLENIVLFWWLLRVLLIETIFF